MNTPITQVYVIYSEIPSVTDVMNVKIPRSYWENDRPTWKIFKGCIDEKLRLERAEMDGVTRRWVADSRSGWLAQNVRPLTLCFFTVSYIVGWYMEYDLTTITGLMQVILGGYFGSRGVEKVFGNKLHK